MCLTWTTTSYVRRNVLRTMQMCIHRAVCYEPVPDFRFPYCSLPSTAIAIAQSYSRCDDDRLYYKSTNKQCQQSKYYNLQSETVWFEIINTFEFSMDDSLESLSLWFCQQQIKMVRKNTLSHSLDEYIFISLPCFFFFVFSYGVFVRDTHSSC